MNWVSEGIIWDKRFGVCIEVVASLNVFSSGNNHTHTWLALVVIYRQTSNIRRTSVGNTIVDHSDVVGATPVGAAPTTSSFSTKHLTSMNWTKTNASRGENHVTFGIGCNLYQIFYGSMPDMCKIQHSKRTCPVRQVINCVAAPYNGNAANSMENLLCNGLSVSAIGPFSIYYRSSYEYCLTQWENSLHM